LRDLIVFGIVMLTLPTAFRKPFVGLLLFSWLAYMRPQDLCWSFARGMRFSFYVAVTMVVGWFVNESHKRRFFVPELRSYLLLAMAVFISISLMFASSHSAETPRYYFEFVKIIAISLFTISQVDTKKRLRLLLWVICGSLAFYSVKNGVVGLMKGGTVIIRGPGGMLEDNNDFALALVMNIPLLFFLSRLETNEKLRKVCVLAIGLTMVTVLLTHSRGGFLAMSTAIAWIAFRSGKLAQASLALVGLVIGFFLFAPAHVVNRIMSISEGAKDSSVASRLESWMVGIRMAADNPLWGVGLRNFIDNAKEYGMAGTGDQLHVAHNSFIQIAAEGGGVTFVTYIALLLSVFWSSMWLRRVAKVRPDLYWAGQYAAMFEAINLSFIVGGTFLNRGHFDLIYHFLALVGSTVLVVRATLARGPVPESDDEDAPAPAGPITVAWRSPDNAAAMPRWERTT
jgi:probable O-glycosylation ligase (exosortase A-associated)